VITELRSVSVLSADESHTASLAVATSRQTGFTVARQNDLGRFGICYAARPRIDEDTVNVKILHVWVTLEGCKKESLNFHFQVRRFHLDDAILQDALDVLDLEAGRLVVGDRAKHRQVVIDPIRVGKLVAEVAEDTIAPVGRPYLISVSTSS